jgi:hypothetical protein
MGDSVLNFLKAEWKVSDTGSAHWASTLTLHYVPTVRRNNSLSEGNNSVIGDITLYVGNKLQLSMCKDNIKVGGITLYVEV